MPSLSSIARLARPLSRPLSLRAFSSLPPSASASSFSRPAPLPLPRAEQQEFEELLRRVQNPARAPAADGTATAQPGEAEMHPDFRPKPRPLWEGKTNPLTGEVDGPKHEPLEHGDWSYNGRATDF